MDPYETLYVRRCHSLIGWFEMSEVIPLGIDFLQDSFNLIRIIHGRLYSKKKAYANSRLYACTLRVGDRMFLYVFHIRDVMSLRKMICLAFYILDILRFSVQLVRSLMISLATNFIILCHSFHISILSKYIPDFSQVISWDTVQLDDSLTFVEETVPILASML